MLHILLFYAYIYYNDLPKSIEGETTITNEQLFEQILPFKNYPNLLHFLIVSMILRSWYKFSYTWLALPDVIQTSLIGYFYYFGDNVKIVKTKKTSDGDIIDEDGWVSALTMYNILYYFIAFVIVARGLIYIRSSWLLVNGREPRGNANANANRDDLIERINELMNSLDESGKSSDEEDDKDNKDKSFQEFKECKPEPKKGRKPPPSKLQSQLNRSPLHQIRRNPNYDTDVSSTVPWFGVISSTIVYIGLFVCLYQYMSKDTNVYNDCWEVKQKGKEDGNYMILQDAKNNRTSFVPCKRGYTVISRILETPDDSYPIDESLEKYVRGYGNIQHQFWLGLSTIYNLNNEFENDVLRIEATTHNGSEIWIEFDNFQIRNSNEEEGASFPITSLGRSSSSTGQQFVLIRPNYFKPLSKRKDPQYTTYEDRDFAYFYTKESSNCRNMKNGWWYPFQWKKNKKGEGLNDIGICHDHNPHYGLNTNLNGVFHEKEELNERSIAVCDVSEKKCFHRDKTGRYTYKGKTLKLRTVEMMITRKIQGTTIPTKQYEEL